MLFNSYIFIFLFLPACLCGYFLWNHFKCYRMGLLYLLCMSLWFYGYFNPKYLVLITGSILGNYGIYRLINRFPAKPGAKVRKIITIAGITLNLAVLGYFKYTDFFLENINRFFGQDFNLINIALPLGISFFTFQQVSFLADACQAGGGMGYSLLEYAAYVAFFPQLVAGPIVTHDVLVPQLRDRSRKQADWGNLSKGTALFVFGLAKKVLLADVFGNAANWAFSDVGSLNATTALLAMLFYTIQIYFDFSGYSDMAVGLGWMVNIDLPVNFASPYKALTITGFWKRWHMTLTAFFTKYVYIPLGGGREGAARTYANIFIVFFLSGLWHGAGWTFLLWGLMHGAAQVLERLCRKWWGHMHPVFSWALAFGFINIAWVFFRAGSISEGLQVLKAIARMDFGGVSSGMAQAFSQPEWQFLLGQVPGLLEAYPYCIMLGYCVAAFVIILGMPDAKTVAENHIQKKLAPAVVAFLFVWCVFSFGGVSTFLYFNF